VHLRGTAARAVWFLSVLLFAALARAEQDDNPLGMTYLETPDLRLIWFEPLGYLAPHATRTFTSSAAWQRRMFGWTPSEPTTVLLKDHADFGHASATAMPRNRLFFDIAPLSHAFETYPASERLYSLMNHELVHVVHRRSGERRRPVLAALFYGKVSPTPGHPESLLYSYLTVPRFNVPRWYLEGSADVRRDLDGRRPRPRPGRLRRDGLPRHGPRRRALLRPARPGVLRRALGLPGRRQRLPVRHALHHLAGLTWSPEQVLQWMRRDDGSARHYADQFRARLRLPLEDAWQQWIAFEQRLPARQPGRDPEASAHAAPASSSIAPLGSISRVYFDEATGNSMAASAPPAPSTTRRRQHARRNRASAHRDQGAMLYRVTSFAFDPVSGTAFYTSDNWRCAT
jgi:hypothetical protein